MISRVACTLLLLFVSCSGARKQTALKREKARCIYESVQFTGTFLDMRDGIAQFQRLTGEIELVVMDSVQVTGKLIRDGMVRVKVTRSAGGICGPTFGTVSRM